MPTVDQRLALTPPVIAAPGRQWKLTNISPFNNPKASPCPDAVFCSKDDEAFYVNSDLLITFYVGLRKVFARVQMTPQSMLRIEDGRVAIHVDDTAENIATLLRAAYSPTMPIPADLAPDAFFLRIQALNEYKPTDSLVSRLVADFTDRARANPLDTYAKAYLKKLPSPFIQAAATLCLDIDNFDDYVLGHPQLGGNLAEEIRWYQAVRKLNAYKQACKNAVPGLVGELVGGRQAIIGLSFLEGWQMHNTPWVDCLHRDRSEITIGKGRRLIRIMVVRWSVLLWEELLWELHSGAPSASTVDMFMRERLPSLLKVVGSICDKCVTSVPSHMNTVCDRLKVQLAKVQRREFKKEFKKAMALFKRR